MYWRQVVASTKQKPLTKDQLFVFDGSLVDTGTMTSSLSGWEPKRLWHAQGDGGFEETAYAEGFDSRFDGRSLVAFDADGDGDQELLMLSRAGQRLQLFENAGQGGGAVELELWPRSGARDADAVLVRAEGLGVFSSALARGYASSVAPTVHLGLGARKEVTVEVQWRDGSREKFGPLRAGSRHTLSQGDGPKASRARRFSAPKEQKAAAWPATLGALGLEPSSEKPTLVQLFTRGCKPCAEEATVLAKLDRARVVGLGLVGEGDTAEASAKSLGISYPVRVLDAGVADAMSRSGELPLPLLLLYGTDGALKRVLPGPAQLAGALAE